MKIQHFILTSVMMIGGVAAYASGTFRLDSGKGCAVLNTENAALIRLETEDGEIPFSTVAQGIWSATFADGKKISAKDFKPAQITSSRKGNKAEYTFGNEQIKVVLLLAAGNGFMDISAEVTPLQKDIKEFSLPGKIRFQSGMVEGITTQNNWPRNVGMTFNKKFFESRLNAPGLRWKRGSVIGGGLYAAVFDGRPAINLFPSRKLSTPEITQQGRAWLGEDFAAKLAGSKVFATRPFNTDQAKIVLADTPDGVFLGGQQYGSKGYCFRIGGYFQDKDKAFRREVICRLALEAAKRNGRSKIALVAFPMGEFFDKQDFEEFKRLFSRKKIPFTVISTPEELVAMLNGDQIGSAINCMGEHCPMPANMKYGEFAKRLRAFMGKGGSWFETHGYSFHYRLAPEEYLTASGGVPSGAADLHIFEMTKGKFAIYSIQKLRTKPNWDPTDIYVPSEHAFSGSQEGGNFEHTYKSYIRKGKTLLLPAVRIRYGVNPADAAKAFCADNGSTQTLQTKLPEDKFKKFSRAIIYKVNPNNVKEVSRFCNLLPPGGFIHFSNFMKHGFDIGLPEIFPPNKSFGTPEEFKKMTEEIRAKGFLFMPYINNTWWGTVPVKCDYYKKAGNGALLRTEKNSFWLERYGNRHGYAITMWHPAVRAANKIITDALVNDYPADLIFQDQIGGRGNMMDFNPASPVPHAYAQGMINTVRDDAPRALLACEDGWYGVMDNMVMFCGASFGLTEPRANPAWEYIYERWPKDTFQLYSLLGAVAHDKIILSHHDLGGFVHTDRQLALTLGLGYTLIMRTNLIINGKDTDLLKEPYLEYAKFATALQKHIVAAYIGKPQKAFVHQWTPGDVGIIRAEYGDVKIVSNMDKKPLASDYGAIAPNGFLAVAPDAVAGYPAAYPGSAFIATKDKVYLFCKNGAEMEFPLLDSSMTKAVSAKGEVFKLERNGKNAKIRLGKGDASFNRLFELKLQK